MRIDCTFGCGGDHGGRKEIAINAENPQKIFQCHAKECGFRGNLLTLMHGFLTASKPSGGKLKAEEFQRVKRVLAGNGQPIVSGTALAQWHSIYIVSSFAPRKQRDFCGAKGDTAVTHLPNRVPLGVSPRFRLFGL